jgi:phage terminase small subunit
MTQMVDNSSALAGTQTLSAFPVQAAPDLTSKQDAFARAYVQGCSVADAYRFAYQVGDDTAPATVRNNGYKVLNHPRVAVRIRQLQEAAGALTTKSTALLIAELEEMAGADLNELVQLVVGACRSCWGEGGAHQWRDDAEYARACDEAMATGTSLPSMAGGFGYRFEREPNPECSQCDGAGIQRVRFTNTGDLSPGVRRLFRGIELFPDGSIKRVLLHDQMAARVELHRLKGMHIERSVSVTAHVPVPPLKDMSPEAALEYLESLKPTRPAPITVEATVITSEQP